MEKIKKHTITSNGVALKNGTLRGFQDWNLEEGKACNNNNLVKGEH